MTNRLAPSIRIAMLSGALFWTFKLNAAVDDSFPAEKQKWRCVLSPHFEVFTGRGSESDARDVAFRLEALRAFFFGTMHLSERRPISVAVFAFDSDDDFFAYGMRANYAGVYLERLNQAVILLRTVSKPETTLPVIAHEYIHCLFRIGDENPTPWFNEGSAELFSTAEVEGKTMRFGRPPLGRLNAAKETDWLPFETLFTIDRRSPHLGSHNLAAPFYAESWALLHYLYFGQNKLSRPGITEFLRIGRDPRSVEDPDKLRASCQRLLGLDYPALLESVQEYVHTGQYRPVTVPLPPLADPKTYVVRKLERREIHLRLAGLAFHVTRDPVSKFVLQEAAKQATVEPWVLEALAENSAREHDEAAAQQYWERAIAAGSTNPAAYRELALMENRKWFGRFNYDFRLESKVADHLRDVLKRSISLFPQQYTAYEVLAWVEAAAPELDLANSKLVAQNFALVKDRARTILALAIVEGRCGHTSDALECLDKMVTFSPSSALVNQAKIVRSRLQPPKDPLPSTPPTAALH